MKKLLLAIALLAGVSINASAITEQDLDGKIVCQVYWGNDYQPGPVLSTVGKFSLEGNQLYIRNFRGRFKLPITLSNDQIILPLLKSFNGEDPTNTTFRTGMLGATQGLHLDNRYSGEPLTKVNGYHAACYQIHDKSEISSSTYSTSAYANISLPNFYIAENHSLAFVLNGSDSNFAIYKKMGFFILDNLNATANDSNGQEYGMQVNLLDNNVISFPNLYNRGIMYQYDKVSSTNYNYSFKWIKGDYTYTNNKKGTIFINSQKTGGTYKCGYYGYKTFYSGSLIYGYWKGYWYSAEGQAMMLQKLASDLVETSDENQFYSISGSFDVRNVYHETVANSWSHHDKGDLHTYEDWDITIDESNFYNQAATTVSGRYGLEQNIEWTKINAKKLDVTHHCKIASDLEYGYGTIADDNPDNYLYIGGQVEQLKNTHHLDNVDYYEYFVVPGTHTSPSGADFKDAEKGHVNGVNVTNYITNFQPAANNALRVSAKDLNEGNNFNLLFPEKLFAENGIATDPNHKYTLYVKAHYNPETNLEPTFHALTPLNTITTGVNDLELNLEPANIKVVDGGIAISGSNGTAMVSTLSGVVVYQGGDNTVSVAPGMYIVRAAGAVKKVLVK